MKLVKLHQQSQLISVVKKELVLQVHICLIFANAIQATKEYSVKSKIMIKQN